MAFPAATVRITITRILAIPAATLATGHTRYLRAEVQGSGTPVKTGRSREVPATGGDFDLAPEQIPWQFELRVDPGTNISVTVEAFEDRGDLAPPTPSVLTGVIADPWTSGKRTLVGPSGSIELDVTTTLITSTDAAFLARAGKPTGVSGTLTVPQCYVVQIADIQGLYQPGPIAAGSRGAAHVLGYVSEDNLGRIFTNRLPNGNWARDTQYVEVFLRVTAIGGATIPASARIKWTVLDADDPTNDASNFHHDWGVYVDPNDYGAGGSADRCQGGRQRRRVLARKRQREPAVRGVRSRLALGGDDGGTAPDARERGRSQQPDRDGRSPHGHLLDQGSLSQRARREPDPEGRAHRRTGRNHRA